MTENVTQQIYYMAMNLIKLYIIWLRELEIYFMMNVINEFPYKAKSVVPEIYYIAKIYIDLTSG